jgi:KaiC/GvpD/RAD55 family RecA-like ATPase
MKDLLDIIQTRSGVALTKKANTDGGEYAGPCPFCGGKDRFRVWPNREKPGYMCRQCNRKGDAIEFVRQMDNLSFQEACEAVGKDTLKPKKRIPVKKQQWEICNSDGQLVATHFRVDFDDGSKEYPWQRDGRSGLCGITPSHLPLYGSEKIRDWESGDIIITEGEKAADALIKAGFQALGTVCGANVTPDRSALAPLAGKPYNIILWPDNDQIGMKHMAAISSLLQEMRIESQTIQIWPKARPKDDAVDYIAGGLDPRQIIDDAKIHRTAPYYPPSYLLGAAYDAVMDAINGDLPAGYVSTGYARLDDRIDGWGRWLTVICGRAGMGKTTWGLQAIVRAAKADAKGVIISIETPRMMVQSRLAMYESGVNWRDIRRRAREGTLTMEERDEAVRRLTSAYAVVNNMPILIRDKQRLTPDELRRDIEMLLAREKIGPILIDHMGKIQGDGKSAYERASYVSKELSAIALEYDVPIIALCQLNRDVEKRDRKDKRPVLADLRASGEIEEDARVVLGLYRDSYYTDTDLGDLTQALVLKYNEGEARFAIPFHSDPVCHRMTPWPKDRMWEFERYVTSKGWLPR